MNKTVLLMNPYVQAEMQIYHDQQCYFPLGLLYLATILRKNGYGCCVIDFNNLVTKSQGNPEDFLRKKIIEILKNYQPFIVGVGCMFSGSFRNSRLIAKIVKEIKPSIPIAIGGIHPTLFATEILDKYDNFDFVIIGEGEDSFLELVKSVDSNQKNFSKIDGITYRENGHIKKNTKMNFINDLDTLPFVDYNIVNVDDYRFDTTGWYSPKGIEIGQPFSILTSRSCPERCSFCSMWQVHGSKIRYRSSENVLEELESIISNYGSRYFHFMDDNMTFDRKRILDLCNGIIKRNLNIQFDTPNGVAIKTLDEEVIDALVEAGLVRISLAIESGSEYIRNKVLGKRLKEEKIYEVVDLCAKHNNLFIMAFFIIGSEEETHGTLDESFTMMKNLPLDKFAVSLMTPYPGTKVFDNAVRNNLLSLKRSECMDYDSLHFGANSPHIKPYKLEKEELVNFRNKAVDLLRQKRSKSKLPGNYPLRFNGQIR